ncbi:MAG TPA: ABC transporter permease [Pusillimonas sp.]|uniref:ABC transporter permease n=1 Tax=Pusillimonas sp. TaxID=3040095 RepID=UPI002C5A9FF5|nr:ABC transporter permease [Pusillimonas sp.]HUH88260.1 ABC transporter permease [Pusillimonas sp.]
MSTETIETPAVAAPGRRQVQLGPAMQRYALLIALVVFIVVFSMLRPATFFTLGNLTTILSTQAALVILAIGVTIVLLVGEFDLSVASVMGMSATAVAYLTANASMDPALACVIALGMAVVVGLVNALFIVGLGINSFIVTLGMGTLVTGLAVGAFGSMTIGGLPIEFTTVFQTQIQGVQLSFLYMLAIGLCFYIALGFMPIGRSMFFTGNARKAAMLAGIRTDLIRAVSLVLAAVLSALAGIVLCGQTAAASPTIANAFLLPAYAAVFLGSTAFTPGRFNVWGTIWAVYFLAVGTTGLQFLGLQSWVVNVFEGAVLVLAVTFSAVFARSSRH